MILAEHPGTIMTESPELGLTISLTPGNVLRA
jgi:hypothetical protein